MEAVHALSLRHRVSTEDEPWSEGRLRDEMRRIVEEADVRATDLLEAWDDSGDGRLRKKEWLVHFKRLFGGGGGEGAESAEATALWYDKVRCAVDEAFDTLDALNPDQPRQVGERHAGMPQPQRLLLAAIPSHNAPRTESHDSEHADCR